MTKLFVLLVLTVIAAGYTHANRHEITRGSPLQDVANHAAAGMPGRQGPFSNMHSPSGRGGHHRGGQRGHGLHSVAASRGQTGSSGLNRLAQFMLTDRKNMGRMDGESRRSRHHQRMMDNMRAQMSRHHQMTRRGHDLRRPGQGRRGQGRREPMRTAGSTDPRTAHIQAAMERLGFAPTGDRHGRRGGMRHGMRGHRIGSHHGIGGHGIGGHGMRGHGHRRGEGRHGIHMMRRGYGLGPHNTVA